MRWSENRERKGRKKNKEEKEEKTRDKGRKIRYGKEKDDKGRRGYQGIKGRLIEDKEKEKRIMKNRRIGGREGGEKRESKKNRLRER